MDTSTGSSSVESEAIAETPSSLPPRADLVRSAPSAEVQPSELAEFVRWHAGWDLVEIRPWPNHCSSFPLLLHELAWDATQRALVVRTLQGAHPDSMVRLVFRIEDVMTVRVATACSRPERCLYIRTRPGRLVTLRVSFSLQRKAAYEAARRRLEHLGEMVEKVDVALTAAVERKEVQAMLGETADCTLGSGQPAVS